MKRKRYDVRSPQPITAAPSVPEQLPYVGMLGKYSEAKYE